MSVYLGVLRVCLGTFVVVGGTLLYFFLLFGYLYGGNFGYLEVPEGVWKYLGWAIWGHSWLSERTRGCLGYSVRVLMAAWKNLGYCGK